MSPNSSKGPNRRYKTSFISDVSDAPFAGFLATPGRQETSKEPSEDHSSRSFSEVDTPDGFRNDPKIQIIEPSPSQKATKPEETAGF